MWFLCFRNSIRSQLPYHAKSTSQHMPSWLVKYRTEPSRVSGPCSIETYIPPVRLPYLYLFVRNETKKVCAKFAFNLLVLLLLLSMMQKHFIWFQLRTKPHKEICKSKPGSARLRVGSSRLKSCTWHNKIMITKKETIFSALLIASKWSLPAELSRLFQPLFICGQLWLWKERWVVESSLRMFF